MWVSVKEAAKELNISERAIRAACQRDSKKYKYRMVDGHGGIGKVYEIWLEDENKNENINITNVTNVTNVTNDDDFELTHVLPKITDRHKREALLKGKVCLLAIKRKNGLTLSKFIDKLGREFDEIRVNEINLKRWMREYKRAVQQGLDGVDALLDNRGRPTGIVALRDEHKEMILNYMFRRDIRPNLAEIYRRCCLIHSDMPSIRTVERFVEGWKKDNRMMWDIMNNPDKARGVYMPAFGSASEAFKYRNAGWELDATVADVMCSDGKRWTIYALIDIYSRRVCVTMEKTTSSYGVSRNLREGMLKLGVPELIITDNGKDYVSNHIQDMCIRLSIGKKEVEPYSGHKKPHIERFFGTMTRGLFEGIEGFVGHNTKERADIVAGQSLERRHKAIKEWRAKQYSGESFSKAMLKKENAELFVSVPVSSEKLKELIDEWIISYENQKVHRGIKMTPMAKWNEDIGDVRAIRDMRGLDLLMGESLERVVSKDGIKISRDGIVAIYAHSKLALYVGEKVKVILDDSLSKVYIYTLGGKFVCEAEDWAINKDAQRNTIKEAHREYRKVQTKANKLQKQAETTKETVDKVVAEAFSDSLSEFREPKNTSTGAEIKKKIQEEPVKNTGVKKYDGLVDRFVQRKINGEWDEKDEMLANTNKDLYEIAMNKVKEKIAG
ncbi:putative Prophage Mu, DNA transposition protein A [Sulfurovum sp. enrichment culture clone C5]|uniref:Putative Prophage Mu, DNA transposition protein A n=1 Tax=Sulfurovum sp. enrichment culture clone C5 TaxID=497650 RepID=A0A0S4XLL5_9BACT|nr:putative Prophage Mu, DNA transposition protein A [Sulfurovum sp. enrichment culture clone C5]